MTTVAVKNGIMASDRRVSRAGWLASPETKITAIPSGGWAAAIGDADLATAFIEWICRGSDGSKPPLDRGADSGLVLHLLPTGHLVAYSGDAIYRHPPSFCDAWGSGGPAARAALYAGASPREAVLIAARIDPYTGDGVDVVGHFSAATLHPVHRTVPWYRRFSWGT